MIDVGFNPKSSMLFTHHDISRLIYNLFLNKESTECLVSILKEIKEEKKEKKLLKIWSSTEIVKRQV